MFKDKILLITGGTGSFGNAVLNRFLHSDFAEIRIFSRDEKKQEDMRIALKSDKVKFHIGDVREYDSVHDALRGVDVPVLVKNPVNPDLDLWIGAIERIANAGVTQIGAIHRGFSAYAKSKFRNAPYWELPIELRRRMPDLPLICDNSHICGNREDLREVAQQALDLNYDGLMTEVHPTPDEAWSDAKQQITPFIYKELVQSLIVRRETTEDADFLEHIENLRHKIDEVDLELLNLLARRMRIAEDIGRYKSRNNIAILQTVRWNEILEKGFVQGRQRGLNDAFIERFLSAVQAMDNKGKFSQLHPQQDNARLDVFLCNEVELPVQVDMF